MIEQFPAVDVRLTGVVMLNNGFKEATIQDMATMTPIVSLILMATMAWLLRSVSLTVVTFVIIGLSTIAAAGVAVWIGYEISGPVAPAPRHDYDACHCQLYPHPRDLQLAFPARQIQIPRVDGKHAVEL